MLKFACALVSTGALSAVALAHNHVGVNAVNGQLVIAVGYDSDESYLTIGPPPLRRVLDLGSTFVVRAPDALPQAGPYSGWLAADEFLLTSDFFATNLAGGNINYELVSFAPAPGAVSDPQATIVWGDFPDGGPSFVPSAFLGAPDRAGRSFNVGVGSHDHDQAFAVSAVGIYDLTLVAWDANGVFTDSDPITVRIATTCPADYNADGVVSVQDIFDFLQAWFAGDVRADFGGDGVLQVQDIFDFLTAWFAGC